LAFIAFSTVLLYLAACIKAMRERRVSRKVYALIVNRVVADLFFTAAVLASILFARGAYDG
jgi:hypothetical protein